MVRPNIQSIYILIFFFHFKFNECRNVINYLRRNKPLGFQEVKKIIFYILCILQFLFLKVYTDLSSWIQKLLKKKQHII